MTNFWPKDNDSRQVHCTMKDCISDGYRHIFNHMQAICTLPNDMQADWPQAKKEFMQDIPKAIIIVLSSPCKNSSFVRRL